MRGHTQLAICRNVITHATNAYIQVAKHHVTVTTGSSRRQSVSKNANRIYAEHLTGTDESQQG
jgi:hypothetical protein